jgi:catechol 2,3-dioxygenase-like lactoylglutathione lyase family enzyme
VTFDRCVIAVSDWERSNAFFRWEGPISEAVAHLESRGVAVELGPLPRPEGSSPLRSERHGALGAGTSVYFRDPDGSLMEFITYPDPKR